MILKRTHLLLLATTSLLLLSSVQNQRISFASDQNHTLSLTLSGGGDTANLLLNVTQALSLRLDPDLGAGEEIVHVKLNCEAGDDNSFSWESSDSNCTILRLENYDYTFAHGSILGTNGSKAVRQEKELTMQTTLQPGKQQLVAHARFGKDLESSPEIDARKAYITINVGRSDTIIIISQIVGWIYFAAWSISFYPQIWENYKRRSVIGLNFDYVALNITGFLSYSAYNIAIKFIPVVEQEFFHKHPRSQNPIEINDVVFGVHAVFATLIVIIQCFIHERGTQRVSWFSKIFLTVVWIGYIVLGFLVGFTSTVTMLDYIYIFSYVKLAITIIKYIPQAWFNYRRKSTVGWSIGNIFLDFTGGLLSMFQMFLLAYNFDDWLTIMNNFTKFGLGMISILFDVLFLLQHYVFYRSRAEYSSHSALLGNGSSSGAGGLSEGGNFSSEAFGDKHSRSVPSLVRNHNSYQNRLSDKERTAATTP